MVDTFWLARARVVGFAAIEERKNGTGHPQWVTRAVDAPAVTEARLVLFLVPLLLCTKRDPLAACATPEKESKDECNQVDELGLDQSGGVETAGGIKREKQGIKTSQERDGESNGEDASDAAPERAYPEEDSQNQNYDAHQDEYAGAEVIEVLHAEHRVVIVVVRHVGDGSLAVVLKAVAFRHEGDVGECLAQVVGGGNEGGGNGKTDLPRGFSN